MFDVASNCQCDKNKRKRKHYSTISRFYGCMRSTFLSLVHCNFCTFCVYLNCSVAHQSLFISCFIFALWARRKAAVGAQTNWLLHYLLLLCVLQNWCYNFLYNVYTNATIFPLDNSFKWSGVTVAQRNAKRFRCVNPCIWDLICKIHMGKNRQQVNQSNNKLNPVNLNDLIIE